MNAYELADELLRDNTQLTVKAAYMLRQQADQITMLEKETNALRKQLIAVTSELMDVKR
jgi:capsule polysaccharide export protein KpsE/RkpR